MFGGFNLYELGDNIWRLEVVNVGSCTGSFKEIAIHLNLKYLVNLSEIDRAVQEMVAKGDDAVHIGVRGTFIRSFKQMGHERLAS